MEEKKKIIRRSRNGCHNCKRSKIKCDENKPICSYCFKTNAICDYSLKLTWGGRPYKDINKRKQLSLVKKEAQATVNDFPIETSTSLNIPISNNSNSKGDTGLTFILHEFNTDSIKSPQSPSESVSSHIDPPAPHRNAKRKIAEIDGIVDPEIKRKDSHMALTDIFPELNSGMENLTNALADFGGQQFQLQNSDIFSTYISNPQKYMGVTRYGSDSESSATSFLNNYSEDISRIEKYLPNDQSNLIGDTFPMRSVYSSINGSPTSEDIWDSIPPSLTPLPTLLLNVPFYRNLMHFWVTVASQNLVPAPSSIYKDNPYKILLTQMAMEYPAILNTLLAFSAKLRSSLIGADDTPDIVIDQLLSRSCTELLQLLKDESKATSDEALATALLLSCYEVFNSKDFSRHRAHNIGARQIIKARSNTPHKRGPEAGTEGDMTFFLMRWFVYTDVIGALSSTTDSHDYLLTSNDLSTYEPLESLTMLHEIDKMEDETQYPKKTIDYLMGFNIKFLPHFTKITMLVRETNAHLGKAKASAANLPLSIVYKALEVKEALIETQRKDEKSILQSHEKIIELNSGKGQPSSAKDLPEETVTLIKENDILRFTNKIFCDAGLIHLYRRVLLVPRESNLVQDLANGIGELAKLHIESRSPADICCIFCLFTAGCEVLRPEMQQFFEQRFQNLGQMGNINARKGLQIMKRCWETNEDWITAAEKIGVDLTLL
ncbi:fungal zinc cluster transcription factor, putative [Candida dubliniensis CD36]|uniref:Fungal zinc cluster transcription factor, putative n=1 Tax=Candida dubliniensis (strain CD36 / ATCC MYA-646 / CBS 7987 / NCPF 3949 / NRRL Y-17841) TaxID=573826 RepID=B9WE68_CANDC|nr:fungal zinc cluster transcription factor, putative [Candida dubliniensis CD36]CAX42979.1 fungal zinc cluster transcription factor, putative [Candida dubliniensis CD36]